MSRYTEHEYKQHWACFSCKKSFKYPHSKKQVCPQCGKPMVAMGLDFKVPSQGDLRQWRKVKRLHQLGVHFASSGWGGPGPRPKTLRDLKELISTLDSQANGRGSQGILASGEQLASATKPRRRTAETAKRKNGSHARAAAEFPAGSLEAELVAIGSAVPAREWDKVPADFFANLDHYLHGAPKKK